jgi:hypothetical protein
MRVAAAGLEAKPQLNGLTGEVVKYDEAKGRVGVEFPPPFGLLSLKHSNLAHLEGGAVQRSNILLKEMEKRKKKSR